MLISSSCHLILFQLGAETREKYLGAIKTERCSLLFSSLSTLHSLLQSNRSPFIMEAVSHFNNLQTYAKSLRDTRLSSLKHPAEFFNYRQVSRPKDTQEYLKRAGYNMSVEPYPS